MPDILIYRMKMPENEPLRLVLNPNGQLFIDHGVTFTEYEAVELPEHGDLIDRNKLIDALILLAKHENDWRRSVIIGVIDAIGQAPVIIPSNKEESE